MLNVAFTLAEPKIAGELVDDVIVDGNFSQLPYFLMLMGGVVIAYTTLAYFMRYVFEGISQNVVLKIREDIYQKLQNLDFTFFDKTKSGDTLARLTGDVEAIRNFIARVVMMCVQFILCFVIAIILLLTISLPLTLALLLFSPFVAWTTFKLSSKVRPAFSNIREQFSKLNSVAQENISGNRVVKAFAREEYEKEKFEKENQGFMDANINATAIWSKYLPVLEVFASATIIMIILLGGTLVIRGQITIGQLITFNGLLWALNNPMRMSGWLANDIQHFVACTEKIIYLLEAEPRIKNTDEAITYTDRNGHKIASQNSADIKKQEEDASDTRHRMRMRGDITFQNVVFRRGKDVILKDISFQASKGQTIGIIGPTGAGKTSLINLIPRFYDCWDGEVMVDGINVKKWELDTLRDNVAVTMQEVFLFSDTIAANISYGMPDASIEDIKKAAIIASADEFIQKMPDGYETVIGEYGVGLSGGQRQRISLARAILKNTPILIFDDTTSAVDMETEHEIQTALKSVASEKTTFIIAHRISSVKNADLILVIENGKITESGTHPQLMQNKAYYYNTYQNQYGVIENAGKTAKGVT